MTRVAEVACLVPVFTFDIGGSSAVVPETWGGWKSIW